MNGYTSFTKKLERAGEKNDETHKNWLLWTGVRALHTCCRSSLRLCDHAFVELVDAATIQAARSHVLAGAGTDCVDPDFIWRIQMAKQNARKLDQSQGKAHARRTRGIRSSDAGSMRSVSIGTAGTTLFTCCEPVNCGSGRTLRGYGKSGRLRFVFSSAAAARHLRISSWFPPIRTSGTAQPRNSAGRV